MRKSMIACVAVALVLAGGLIALLGPRHCPVNRAAFERIEEGMTRAEVQDILGGPSGDYRTRPAAEHQLWMYLFTCSGWDGRSEDWEGDEGTARVTYGHPDGAGVERVVRVECHIAKRSRSRP
jgi:hypothetical protein